MIFLNTQTLLYHFLPILLKTQFNYSLSGTIPPATHAIILIQPYLRNLIPGINEKKEFLTTRFNGMTHKLSSSSFKYLYKIKMQ